jgi:2-oxoisovalerate dehydrogenase E1 component alpha subunit
MVWRKKSSTLEENHKKESAVATTVARFEVHYTQYLDENAAITASLPPFAQDPSNLLPLYRTMVLTRLFDKKAVALQRTGQLGTYASSLGQEAVSVALGHVMRPEDVLLTTYREYGAQLQRGVTMTDLLLYWGGDERGMAYAEGPHQDFPISVPVASQVPQAVGVAYAMKLRREPRVAVCVLGDGATSKGDFYEAINAAGVWQLPAIFVINNNRWAISVPLAAQTHTQTLAQKAIAAGIPGEQVDGNDIIALQARFAQALEAARNGAGPCLIEALTYRLCDHTTADDASRYREEAEVQAHWRLDPLQRLRTYLTQAGAWSEAKEAALHEELAQEVEAAVQKYLHTPPQAPESMFDSLYATLPPALAKQRQAAIARGKADA